MKLIIIQPYPYSKSEINHGVSYLRVMFHDILFHFNNILQYIYGSYLFMLVALLRN